MTEAGFGRGVSFGALMVMTAIAWAGCLEPAGAGSVADGAADSGVSDTTPDATQDATPDTPSDIGVSKDTLADSHPDIHVDMADGTPRGQKPCVILVPENIQFGGKVVGAQATIEVEVVNCGFSPIVVNAVSLVADGVQPMSPNFGLQLDDTLPITIPTNESWSFVVTFAAPFINPLGPDDKPVLDTASLLVEVHDVANQSIPVSGFGVCQGGPVAVIDILEGEVVTPGTALHLDGLGSYSCLGNISKYEWNVTAPAGNLEIFLPSPASPTPSFTVNLPGTYVFQLEVWDEWNESSYVLAEYQVVVAPDEAILVDLRWTPLGPNSGAGDFSLHFAHPFAIENGAADHDGDGIPEPWFHGFYDCYWDNPNPNWGSFDPTVDDDPWEWASPSQANDHITLASPENGLEYHVGVHAWNVQVPNLVDVRVYIHGVLAFESLGVEMGQGDLWEVATVAWPSGSVTPMPTSDGEPAIISDYPFTP